MAYFSTQPSPTSMGAHLEPHPLQSLAPPTSSAGGYMGPQSPCDDFTGSPYSPPYDNPSPHSLACSSSPHGSPTSLPPPPCSENNSVSSNNGQFTPYMSMSPNSSAAASAAGMHEIPPPSLSSEMPIPPYSSMDHVYSSCNVPTTSVAGFADVSTANWIAAGNALPSFDSFQQQGAREHPHHSAHHHPHHPHHPHHHPHHPLHNPAHYEGGEIPVAVIDMQMHQAAAGGGGGGSPVMVGGRPPSSVEEPPLSFYENPSPSASPDAAHHHHQQHHMFYPHDLVAAAMVHPDMAAVGSVAACPTYPTHAKPTKPTHKKKPKPVVQVNDEHIKDIPTSAQLWEFTLRVLKKPAYNYMINWENRKEGLFRFHDAPAFAALWGKHRNRPNMTYDKVARALRYYYKRDILNQVGGRLTYRFSKRLSKLYAADD